MSKHKVYKTNPLRKYIILSLFIFLFIGLGYSILSTSLDVTGSVNVWKNDGTLYGVFEHEARKGTYVKKYTGEHQDSMNASLSTKDIYYWYGLNDTIATNILDKNNIIFAGFCWQMIRTTDTGGVKIIYNGTPNDGKCNNTSYRYIGNSSFSQNDGMLASVGYMYKNLITYNNKGKSVSSENVLFSGNASTAYWYADSITWGSPVSDKYNLNNPYRISSTNDYPNIVGKYTFMSSTQSNTATTVNYIVDVSNDRIYYIRLGNEDGSTHNLSYYNNSYTYGDSYTNDGHGTYIINNPSTVRSTGWFTSYSSVGQHKYVCKNALNNRCTDLWYTASTSNSSIAYIKVTDNFKYAQGFTYDSDTGNYTLNSNSVTFWDRLDSSNRGSLNTHHYTCWNETGVCNTLSYIFFFPGNNMTYINLKGGKDIGTAVNEMLYNDDVNSINSNVKTSIDNWYQSNMTSYTSYLEDVIFCYNRNQSNSTTNGLNPNGGDLNTGIVFDYDTLKCSNEVDRFSVSNTKAQLTYPVGLANYKELSLLYDGSYLLRKTGRDYWTGSPSKVDNGIFIKSVFEDGTDYNTVAGRSNSVRPVVSLKPGTKYASGNGSINSPYIVSTN